MNWLLTAVRQNPEILLFLVLAVGYALGRIRVGSFQLGGVLGSLIAGLAIGQLGVQVPAGIRGVFFALFLFAVGLRTGAEFFRGLRSSGLTQLALTVTLCGTSLALTWFFARALDLDAGSAAGLLGGAMTNSMVLGSAADAAAGLSLDPAVQDRLADNLATTYAITYVPGLLLVLWFLPYGAPRLLRVNLRDASREVEKSLGSTGTSPSLNSAYRPVLLRCYRLPASFDGLTIAGVESRWPPDKRVIIVRIRREAALLDAIPTMRLREGDIVALAGHSASLIGEFNPLEGHELHDRDLLETPMVSADLRLTNRALGGRTLRELAERLGARGIFLIALRRDGRELPFTPSTVIERGDVLSISGVGAEIARVAAEVGYAEYPSTATDLLLVGTTITLGGLAGLVSVTVGGLSLSLSVSVGVLMAGLVLGHLRSRHPRLGRVPEASVRLFESMGLSAFVACVGLQAGPRAVASTSESGVSLLVASAIIVLVPNILTMLLGYYVLRMNPAILLGVCAGAGGSGPTLAALEAVAESRVPTLGYGMPCAVGNVIIVIGGAVLVLLGAG
jgi:putative transport protein